MGGKRAAESRSNCPLRPPRPDYVDPDRRAGSHARNCRIRFIPYSGPRARPMSLRMTNSSGNLIDAHPRATGVAPCLPPLRKGGQGGSVRRALMPANPIDAHPHADSQGSFLRVCRSRLPGGISYARPTHTLHPLFRATRPPGVSSNGEFPEKSHRCSSRAGVIVRSLAPQGEGRGEGVFRLHTIDAHPRATGPRTAPSPPS
jgi:hypothetical protein